MSSRTNPANDELFFYCPITDEQIRAYGRDGYLRIGRTLTDIGLEFTCEQCMQAWASEQGEFDPRQTWLQNALLVNIHRFSDVVRRYFFHGPLVDVAEKLVDPNIKATSSQLTFKLRGNKQDFAWHQDSGYGQLDPDNSMTTLTALDDTDEQNGCLWIVPGSPARGRIDVAYSLKEKQAKKEIQLEVDESDAIPVPLKAGESLVFHNWMLHKSEGNHSRDRDRRLLFLRYAHADAVEVYNDRKPRLGKLLRGQTCFAEVADYEADLE